MHIAISRSEGACAFPSTLLSTGPQESQLLDVVQVLVTAAVMATLPGLARRHKEGFLFDHRKVIPTLNFITPWGFANIEVKIAKV